MSIRRQSSAWGLLLSLAAMAGTAALLWLTSDQPGKRLLLNTLILCGCSAVLSLPAGTVLAMLFTRTNVAGRTAASLLLLTMLFLPLHATAAGWVAVFGKLGSQAPAFFQTARPLVDGMPAVIWIHAMAAIPWVSLIVSLGLRTIPQEIEDAALLDITPAHFLLGIGSRYYLPFVAAGGLWVMITTAGEMTVTNLYMVPTYAEELYNSVAQGADAPTASIRALPAMCGTVLLIMSAVSLIASILPTGLGRQFQRPRKYDLGAWRWPATAICWLVLFLVVGVPLVSLIVKAGIVKQAVGETHIRYWSPLALANVVGSAPYHFRQELGYSALFAVYGATLALAAALPLALAARRGGVRRWPAIVVAAACWSIPGPLVGLSISWLLNWNYAPLIFLYDKTPLAPGLAMGVKSLPIVILVLWGAFASIPKQTVEAARIDGANGLSLALRIILPQRAVTVAAGWTIALAIGLGDLAWSILVLPPGMETLQRRVFGLIHYGVEEQVAGASLMTFIQFGVLAIAICLLFSRSRRSKPA